MFTVHPTVLRAADERFSSVSDYRDGHLLIEVLGFDSHAARRLHWMQRVAWRAPQGELIHE
jgi:hypothetical protein